MLQNNGSRLYQMAENVESPGDHQIRMIKFNEETTLPALNSIGEH